MEKIFNYMTFRSSSLTVLVVSVLLPGAGVAYYTWGFRKWVASQDGPVCGMPLLGAWGFGALVMASLSLIAFGLGTVAFLRLPGPRPLLRKVELALLVLPFLVVSSYFVAFLV